MMMMKAVEHIRNSKFFIIGNKVHCNARAGSKLRHSNTGRTGANSKISKFLRGKKRMQSVRKFQILAVVALEQHALAKTFTYYLYNWL